MTECPLDEWWSFIHTKEQNLATARRWGETDGDAGVWVALAPEWRRVVALVGGQRPPAPANLRLDRVGSVTDDRVPCFTSDPWPGYPTALLHADGEWYQPERQGKRGRYPAPRCRPPPNWLYAQVVKRHQKGRVVEISRKMVWGSADEMNVRLAASTTSTTINTRFVERDNRAWREHHRRLTRKTTAFSKELPWMEKQGWLSLASYH